MSSLFVGRKETENASSADSQRKLPSSTVLPDHGHSPS